MIDNKIIELLRRVRTIFFIRKLNTYISYSFLIWSIISLIIMGISRFAPIIFVWNKILIALIISFIISVIWSFYKRPSYRETALLIDSMGLEERVITSLDLMGIENDIARLQKTDTINKLQQRNFKKEISIKPPFKVILITLIIVTLTLFISLIKTDSYNLARKIEENEEKIHEEKEKIEKVIKEIEKDEKISSEDKKEIEKILRELLKEINKTNDIKEMDKEIFKAKKELEVIKDNDIDTKLNELAQTLKDREFTKELGDAINEKNQEKVSEEINKMLKQLKEIDKQELDKVAEELSNIAGQLQNSPEVSKALKELSSSLAGNINNISEGNLENEMSNLSETINNMINDSKTSEKIEQISNGLSQFNNTISQISQQENQSSGLNNGAQGENNTGQNGSSGQGNGEEGGNTGGGAGEGSSNGNESNGGSSNSGGNKNSSDKEVKEYEKVFVPKHLGGEGESTQVHGQKGKDGDTEIIQVKKFSDVKGEPIPYSEVIRTYRENAYESLNSEEIPGNMKELVKKYFSEIE